MNSPAGIVLLLLVASNCATGDIRPFGLAAADNGIFLEANPIPQVQLNNAPSQFTALYSYPSPVPAAVPLIQREVQQVHVPVVQREVQQVHVPVVQRHEVQQVQVPVVQRHEVQQVHVPVVQRHEVQQVHVPVVHAPQVQFRSVIPVAQPQMVSLRFPTVPTFRAVPVATVREEPRVRTVIRADSAETPDDDDDAVYYTTRQRNPAVLTYAVPSVNVGLTPSVRVSRTVPVVRARSSPLLRVWADSSEDDAAPAVVASHIVDAPAVRSEIVAAPAVVRTVAVDDDDDDHDD